MVQRLGEIIESRIFHNSIIILIVVNSIILGLETSQSIMLQHGTLLKAIDALILYIFIVEIALRMFVYRFDFLKQPWSLFDLAVVAIALVPASEAFAALRALRVLRVLRLLSAVPTMRKVIEGLFAAIPGIASVATIMLLFFYIFSVLGTHLFASSFPQWFGTLGKTMYTLFQIMTLESWSMGIVRPVMEEYPYAWMFFVTYILVTTFTMLNLFIAIIVNAMHHDAEEEAQKELEVVKRELSAEIRTLEKRLIEEIRTSK